MRDLRLEASGSEIVFPGDGDQHGLSGNPITNHTSIVEWENFEEGVSGAFCCVPGPLNVSGTPFGRV